jgi:hypothetical protein
MRPYLGNIESSKVLVKYILLNKKIQQVSPAHEFQHLQIR